MRSSSAPATGWICPPGRATMRSSGPTGVTCLEAHLPGRRLSGSPSSAERIAREAGGMAGKPMGHTGRRR